MDGVTDASFRAVIARQGKPDVTFTEFTHVQDICRGPEISLETLIYHEMERPMVAQLYGKDPDVFYQAAHAVCELGFDGVDLNMGCPSKSVASSGSGAGLIKTPELAAAIIRATQRGLEDWAAGQSLAQVGFKPARIGAFHRLNEQRGAGPAVRRLVPLSVKTRLGYETVTVEPWIEHLLREKPAVISLHGRTLRQMYRGPADWEAIARAVSMTRGTGTLLFGNGDVQTLDELRQRVQETGVDGVLVGRAVLGVPWFFQQKEQARRGQGRHDDITCLGCEPVPLAQRFAVLLEHARHFQSLYGRRQFHRMRKHLGWYCKAFPHAAAMRARMFRVSSCEELEALVADYQAQGSLSPDESEPTEEATVPASRCS